MAADSTLVVFTKFLFVCTLECLVATHRQPSALKCLLYVGVGAAKCYLPYRSSTRKFPLLRKCYAVYSPHFAS